MNKVDLAYVSRHIIHGSHPIRRMFKIKPKKFSIVDGNLSGWCFLSGSEVMPSLINQFELVPIIPFLDDHPNVSAFIKLRSPSRLVWDDAEHTFRPASASIMYRITHYIAQVINRDL